MDVARYNPDAVLDSCSGDDLHFPEPERMTECSFTGPFVPDIRGTIGA